MNSNQVEQVEASSNVQPSIGNGNDSIGKSNGDDEQLKILGQLKSIEQINEQRRIFLNNTIIAEGERVEESQKPVLEISNGAETKLPANNLALDIKYATLPAANSTTLRSPTSPPPKPPMLSRTRSTGLGDERPISSPPAMVAVANGSEEKQASINTVADKPAELEAPQTISARHYESLIEELRCPGCAGAMKSPVLLCKSGHSICEQCTRILLMCPLCKEAFTTSRSLTVEALCAKAHFRCSHSGGGCMVRLPVALLPWHEKQCIYKPMKCFMGRVWGDCKWHGREIQWKQHLETEHPEKVFKTDSVDLIWNMAARRKALTGYYVFQTHEEMFNFYEISDQQRILFTMTCTSNRRATKYNYAYEVTLLQPDNEALSLTQKFPVHSEYDRDILMEGTCVSISLAELARFVDEEKLLHYRVRVVTVKSPRRAKPPRRQPQPIDHQQTHVTGVNVKGVPASMIITRTYKEAMGMQPDETTSTSGSTSALTSPTTEKMGGESDSEETSIGTSAEPERKWGTPQLHFNRKYLKNSTSDTSGQLMGGDDELRPLANDPFGSPDDKLSLCSTNTSYKKKVSDTLRKSFRAIKTDIIEMRPFSKKSPEKKGK
ncbi:uncharacterized protein LOC115627077 isoform X2 [Scaptodrosophila lebanonensis]|uniref:RING-type E3 ubiquitin transferase n=1 Tax=Drosophila lebanonensis TaxID=7225 RepID=A0A6J2TSG9_DROLE|nr:uncharacterized protein LOC115627077 isoform X2 [Scaptodrosophila lebanonensis]